MLFRIAIGAVLATATTLATASAAEVGDASIKLPTPAGFCELSASNPSDERVLTYAAATIEKSGNKLLGVAADCQQLADWRVQKRQFLDDYVQFQTPFVSMEKSSPRPESIQQTCVAMRAQGEKTMPDPSRVTEIWQQAAKRLKVNSQSFVGVLAEDQDACYAGMPQKVQTEAGTDKFQVILIAFTIIKDKPIFVDRYGVYAGPDTVDLLLAKLKASVAALYAANK